MIDWTKSMRQTFEYYIVDPSTWHDVSLLSTVKSCTITRDSSLDTLGSATLDCDEDLNDKYVRTYIVATQDGETEKIPLGTHLFQTPSTEFDGKRQSISHDGYTPLIELKEKQMQLGFAARKNANILEVAYAILTDNSLRAPVVAGSDDKTLTGDFLAEVDETRLSYLNDLLVGAKYTLGLDELGKVIFVPDKELGAMQPRWIFSDDNSSILYPNFSISRDIFGVPNRIEVIYSPSDGTPITVVDENTDETSIVSYQQRGRWITYRETDPDVSEGVNEFQLREYAHKKLVDLSTIEYQITYKHAFCPDVRLGDCVRFNYTRADYRNENAKVIRQTIRCEEGCPVEETAVLTNHLWEGGDLS